MSFVCVGLRFGPRFGSEFPSLSESVHHPVCWPYPDSGLRRRNEAEAERASCEEPRQVALNTRTIVLSPTQSDSTGSRPALTKAQNPDCPRLTLGRTKCSIGVTTHSATIIPAVWMFSNERRQRLESKVRLALNQ